jgi:hypothetical protein
LNFAPLAVGEPLVGPRKVVDPHPLGGGVDAREPSVLGRVEPLEARPHGVHEEAPRPAGVGRHDVAAAGVPPGDHLGVVGLTGRGEVVRDRLGVAGAVAQRRAHDRRAVLAPRVQGRQPHQQILERAGRDPGGLATALDHLPGHGGVPARPQDLQEQAPAPDRPRGDRTAPHRLVQAEAALTRRAGLGGLRSLPQSVEGAHVRGREQITDAEQLAGARQQPEPRQLGRLLAEHPLGPGAEPVGERRVPPGDRGELAAGRAPIRLAEGVVRAQLLRHEGYPGDGGRRRRSGVREFDVRRDVRRGLQRRVDALGALRGRGRVSERARAWGGRRARVGRLGDLHLTRGGVHCPGIGTRFRGSFAALCGPLRAFGQPGRPSLVRLRGRGLQGGQRPRRALEEIRRHHHGGCLFHPGPRRRGRGPELDPRSAVVGFEGGLLFGGRGAGAGLGVGGGLVAHERAHAGHHA